MSSKAPGSWGSWRLDGLPDQVSSFGGFCFARPCDAVSVYFPPSSERVKGPASRTTRDPNRDQDRESLGTLCGAVGTVDSCTGRRDGLQIFPPLLHQHLWHVCCPDQRGSSHWALGEGLLHLPGGCLCSGGWSSRSHQSLYGRGHWMPPWPIDTKRGRNASVIIIGSLHVPRQPCPSIFCSCLGDLDGLRTCIPEG